MRSNCPTFLRQIAGFTVLPGNIQMESKHSANSIFLEIKSKEQVKIEILYFFLYI